MYKIYGSRSCGQCKIAKRMFDANKIKYTYIDVEDLTESAAEAVFEIARNAGRGNLPIVMDMDTGEIVFWKDVL